jgi:hypothetical protein
MKTYTIKTYSYDFKRTTSTTGTFDMLRDHFADVLRLGSGYTGKGKKKINLRPTTIKSLISNLNASQHNQSRIPGMPNKVYTLNQS